MKIKFLLLGTSLSFLPTLSLAQCVATQDCATLGYTETSCNGGKGVKCPFGNKWACLTNEDEVRNDLCQELGFTQDCVGTGYAGGAGQICNGKYAQCTCSKGYEWKDGNCKISATYTGALGELYYCNGKVVGVKTNGMNFYVALKDLGTMNYSAAETSCYNYSFCGNTKGTLPNNDHLTRIFSYKKELNTLLKSNKGQAIAENWYWSSSEYCDIPWEGANFLNTQQGSIEAYDKFKGAMLVRSVIAF